MPKGKKTDDDLEDDTVEPDEDDLDEDEDDDEEDEDDDEGKSEEELRAELKKARADLAKASKQGGRRAGQVKDLRKRIAELEGKGDDDEDDDEDEDDEDEPRSKSKAGARARKAATDRGLSARDVQKAVDRAVAKERKTQEAERTRERISAKAETALAAAGVTGRALRTLVRELDFDDLTLEKDGTVDGLDDQIDELKTDFPQLFKKARRGRDRINGGDDRDGSGKKRKMSVTERQVAGIRGR